MKISNLREHDENNPIFKGQKCNLVFYLLKKNEKNSKHIYKHKCRNI